MIVLCPSWRDVPRLFGIDAAAACGGLNGDDIAEVLRRDYGQQRRTPLEIPRRHRGIEDIETLVVAVRDDPHTLMRLTEGVTGRRVHRLDLELAIVAQRRYEVVAMVVVVVDRNRMIGD